MVNNASQKINGLNFLTVTTQLKKFWTKNITIVNDLCISSWLRTMLDNNGIHVEHVINICTCIVLV